MYSDVANIAYKYNVQIEALYRFSGKTAWYPCMVFEINEWGATLKIMQCMIKGDRVDLKISLDDEEIIISGEINETAEPKYTVNFKKTDSNVRAFISKLVSRVFNEKKDEINTYKRIYG